MQGFSLHQGQKTSDQDPAMAQPAMVLEDPARLLPNLKQQPSTKSGAKKGRAGTKHVISGGL